MCAPRNGSLCENETVQSETAVRDVSPVGEEAEDKLAACIESLMQEGFLPVESSQSLFFGHERPCCHPFALWHKIIASISHHVTRQTEISMVLHEGCPHLQAKSRNKLHIYSNRHILR